MGGEGAMAGCSLCTHRYCVACVKRYWEKQIFSGAHARLACMHGGCGVHASDADVARVVDTRAYRRMRYFRARDTHPDGLFCPYEPCWALLPPGEGVITCNECQRRVCADCEQPWDENHTCATPKGRGVFASRLWAVTHTKACPSCNARIQRARGCAHMTCARCTAYFCWRCRGFLHNDCNRGRTCVCDKIITGAAYGGLAAVAVIGAPVIITGAILGGAPWLVYRLVKRNKRSAEHNIPGARPDEIDDDLARFMALRNRSAQVPQVSGVSAAAVPATTSAAAVALGEEDGGAELCRRNTK